jgi:hypothetical protein
VRVLYNTLEGRSNFFREEQFSLAIPDVSADALSAALAEFDNSLRSEPEWQGWETKLNHKYAIEVDGRFYPVKQIVSMATGTPKSDFNGGDEANGYVTSRGLRIVTMKQAPTPNIWWVNQRDTYAPALQDGHIACPIVDKGGAQPSHWKAVSEVRAGDLIVHCVDQSIRALGRATSDAFILEGLRRVDVEYAELNPAIPIPPIADEIRKLQIHQGPFEQVSGRRQGYLFRLNARALRILRNASTADWPDWAEKTLDQASELKIVKIAPGSDASEWGDCLNNGYICVGWDEIGDLEQFETKEEFGSAFAATTTTRLTLRRKQPSCGRCGS